MSSRAFARAASAWLFLLVAILNSSVGNTSGGAEPTDKAGFSVDKRLNLAFAGLGLAVLCSSGTLLRVSLWCAMRLSVCSCRTRVNVGQTNTRVHVSFA
jgi:hypothetical protein